MEVYLGLGTNLGQREENLQLALKKIQESVGEISRLSSTYKTEPWGFQSKNYFLNAAVCVDTELSPREVLKATQKIEKEMGRKVKSKNGVYHDRIIDIDILLYGDVVVDEPDLKIPHPLIEQRDFVKIPLNEIKK